MRVFVTDANDEPPEFQSLPFITDVPEVTCQINTSSLKASQFVLLCLKPDHKVKSLYQDTAPGSSIYRVHAIDKDLGSGGSVSYYLQVTFQNAVCSIFLCFYFESICNPFILIKHMATVERNYSVLMGRTSWKTCLSMNSRLSWPVVCWKTRRHK